MKNFTVRTKIALTALALFLAFQASGEEWKTVGVLGNSGTDARPLTYGPIEREGETSLGFAYWPEKGRFYFPAGSGKVVAMDDTGEVVAEHPAPGAFVGWHGSTAIAGTWAVFCENMYPFKPYWMQREAGLRARLWRLQVGAADGTKVERVPLPAGLTNLTVMSSAPNAAAELALYDGTSRGLFIWSPEGGACRRLAEVPTGIGRIEGLSKPLEIGSAEFDGKGRVVLFGQKWMMRLEDGGTWTIRRVIGERLNFNNRLLRAGNFWYCGGWGNVIHRFDADFNLAPGVAYGGSSGYSFAKAHLNPECDQLSGIVELGPDVIAIMSGRESVSILRFDVKRQQFDSLARFGAVRTCKELAFAGEDYVKGPMNWQWDSAKDAEGFGDMKLTALKMTEAETKDAEALKTERGYNIVAVKGARAVAWDKKGQRVLKLERQKGTQRAAGLDQKKRGWWKDAGRNTGFEWTAKIAIPHEAVDAGVVTVAIDDKDGHRVRNLVGARPKERFEGNVVEWDLRDDDGRVVVPGEYAARVVAHKPITYRYLNNFANGGDKDPTRNVVSDHCCMEAVTACGGDVFFAAPFSESGVAYTRWSMDGRFKRAYQWMVGESTVDAFAASDGKRFFALKGGSGVWSRDDKNKAITLAAFDVESGDVISLGPKKFATLWEYADTNRAIAGLVFLGGRLYVGDALGGNVRIYEFKMDADGNSATIKESGGFAASGLEALAAGDDGKLYLTMDGKVCVVKEAQSRSDAEELFTCGHRVQGLAVRGGTICLTGNERDTVEIWRKRLWWWSKNELGEPGGAYDGAWRKERMVKPNQLAFDSDGKLWVAEKRWHPKRAVRWDVEKKEVLKELVAGIYYGAPGGGMDKRHPGRWIGFDCLWNVDAATGGERIVSILEGDGERAARTLGNLNRFERTEQGRTLVLGSYAGWRVGEVRQDGTLKPLAHLATSVAFAKFFKQDLPKTQTLALWTDANGDGEMQKEEFATGPENFSLFMNEDWFPTGWITCDRFFVTGVDTVTKRSYLVPVVRTGWNAVGAPVWDIATMMTNRIDVTDGLSPTLKNVTGMTQMLRDGSVIVGANNRMMRFTSEGRMLWSIPNLYRGVHGSHKAPLFENGETVMGLLFPLGEAVLKDGHTVTAWMSNRGHVYLVSDDGFFVQRLFGGLGSFGLELLGGEPFGGVMEQADDGTVFLQAGHKGGYRIYTLEGLDGIRRVPPFGITVTPAQMEQAASVAVASEDTPKSLTVRRAEEHRVKNNPASINWSFVKEGASWKMPQGTATVKLVWDDVALHVQWTMPDVTPWLNGGKDWTLLFKTGDGVDLQLRTKDGHVRRVFLAPFDGGTAAVLYDFGAKSGNTLKFTSPWRSVEVNDVRRIDSVSAVSQRVVGVDVAIVELRLPWKTLGLSADDLKAGVTGDVGMIWGEAAGKVNVMRGYYFNKATGLVNDVPGEIDPPVKEYGKLIFN